MKNSVIPKIVLICCVFAVTVLSSCGFYAQRERIVLYKQIIATNDTLDRMTKDWHILLDKAVKTKSFGGLTQNRIKLGQYISRHRALIANLEVPPDAETLRESEGVFLSAQANMVADVYPQFELFADLTPEETIQKSLKAVSRDMETEIAWNLTIKKSLDAFAIKHRIKSYKL